MCLYYSYFHPNKLSHAESEGKWLIQTIQKSSKSKLNFWSQKRVWIWDTEKDISELEKYWNETLSTDNEKSRSLPRFRSLEPYSLTLARRESENNREDSYQLSASVLI